MNREEKIHLPAALCLVALLVGPLVQGARILGLFPIPATSHLAVTSPVMGALAKAGHDVTVFSAMTTGFNGSNYREILYEHVPINRQFDILSHMEKSWLNQGLSIIEMGLSTTEAALANPQAKALIESNEKFDLVVTEMFLNQAFLMFAHKFRCPIILISTLGTSSAVNDAFGNSAPYSYVPSEFLEYGDRMSFVQRFENAARVTTSSFFRNFFFMRKQQELADKYFSSLGGNELPNLKDIEKQAALILLNSHPAFSTPRPYMPNMIDVAGMHLKPTKPLPTMLQRYMDGSRNGAILFSLGSAMESIRMPEGLIRAFKGAFERLPYDVLWKWENDTMENKPKNVHIWKWLPQADLLAHPNLKMFITHGGIASTMEAVFHRVPIVGIPLFGDQKRNVFNAWRKGYAEILQNPDTLTEDEIYNAAIKVLQDPTYQENVNKVSAYWKDTMNDPLDVAVHWVEYVIKHDGAKHLRSAVHELNFIQFFLLDIFAVLIIGVLAIFFSVYFTGKKALAFLSRKQKPKPKRSTKKNK